MFPFISPKIYQIFPHFRFLRNHHKLRNENVLLSNKLQRPDLKSEFIKWEDYFVLMEEGIRL